MRLLSWISSTSRRFVACSSRLSSSKINIDKSVELGTVIPETSVDDVAQSQLIGNRKHQEDRCSVVKFSDNVLYAGIFDGHGGSFAVDFAFENLCSLLKSRMEDVAGEDHHMSELLKSVFCDVNDLLLAHIKKAKPRKLSTLTKPLERFCISLHVVLYEDCSMYVTVEKERYSGTTATVGVLIDSTHLHIASVGDSRAIICCDGKAVPLTDDHSPDKPAERDRIESSGGNIISNSLGDPLVNGRLAMTRSIGDFDLKVYGVTSEPDYTYRKINHAKDSFLILVTDGVTFSLSNDEIVQVTAGATSSQQAADQVVQSAIEQGSHDNSSAILIPLRPWEALHHKEAIPGLSLGTLLSSRDMRWARD